MVRFSILPRALVALNAIRSTEANRPILNGVHLAPDGTMTATDGHCLLTWRDAAEHDDTGTNDAATPDGYVLEITPALLRLAKLRKCARLALEITDTVAKWTPVTANYRVDESSATLARVLDGPYPNYRQVIPRDVPEDAGVLPPLNASYVARFALAAGHMNNGITLTPTGDGRAVLVNFPDQENAFGLVMPLNSRVADAPRIVPAWVHPVTAAPDLSHACTACARTFSEAPSEKGYCPECARPFAPAPDCPAAEHDDTNAECICAHRMRIPPADVVA